MQGFTAKIYFLLFFLNNLNGYATGLPIDTMTQVNFIQLSQDFIYAAKTDDSTTVFIDALAKADEDLLAQQLNHDTSRLAFWLNLYNAYTQVILKSNPGRYRSRSSFFKSRQINIAGNQVSLDIIEHGILRRSKVKWSLGYFNTPFPSVFEKKFRVTRVDYRIHFSLNCGAKSCPPIAFYDPSQIDRQLTQATKNYLKNEAIYDTSKNTLYLPAIMGWFRRDFGGKKKMVELVTRIGLIPPQSDPRIKFNKYDWSLFLNNYKSENEPI